MKIHVRSMVAAPPGKVLVACDLSQAESWIVAYLANEMNMKHALMFGDIHTETAGSALFHAEAGCPHSWEIKIKGELWACPKCANEVTKLMRYVGKRYNHACVDDKTEVLTLDGWLSIAQLNARTKIAQYDGVAQEISFTIPTALHNYEYSGEMHHWKGHNFDQFVTPNHRMPLITNYKLRIHESATLAAKYKSGHLPISGTYTGPANLKTQNLILIAAIQADGMFVANKVVFHLKRERKIIRLRTTLEELKISYKFSTSKDGSVYIRFTPPQEVLFFLEDKKFTSRLLILAQAQLRFLLDEVTRWDGSNKGNYRYYYSKHRGNAEWIKTVAHLCGQSAIINEKNDFFVVSINNRTRSEFPALTRHQFNGRVYCVTVPTGLFLIRRQGKISVTGNSAYRMGAERAAQIINKDSDKPPFFTVTVKESKRFSEAWHNYYNLKVWWGEIENQLNATRSLRTPYGRERTFFAAWGNELFKEATAYVPQSCVADHFNGRLHPDLGIVGGLKEIHKQLIKGRDDRKIINQSHDSFVAEIPKGDEIEFVAHAKSLLLRPLVVRDEEFTIPVDAEIGKRYGELERAA